MKKFLLYVVVVVTLLFLGFTIYYLSLNDETISLNISNEKALYLNKGEDFELPITWTKPSKETTLTISVNTSSVLDYNSETKIFRAIGGGFTTVTITPSNNKFGPFAFEVYVGDGDINSPYVISTAQDLAGMESDKYYVLDSDIDLVDAWTPVADFSGNFNGNGHTIYNLKINSTENAGFFANILSDGVVENVKFDRVAISGAFDNVGAVAGINYGTVGKVEVLGSIANTKADGNTGLLVGSNLRGDSYAKINMCSAKGSLVADGNVGGLVGKNESSIILNSKAIVTNVRLSSDSSIFGGLVGLNSSTKVGDTYYASAIAKVYTIVEGAVGANIGAVIGKNNENNDNNPIWYNKYEDIYYAVGSGVEMPAVKLGASNVVDTDNISSVSKNDLLNEATYVNFNFETVWTKEDSKYAEINLNGTYESIYIKGLKKELSAADEISLIDFLNSIRANLTVDSIYNITEDVTYDLEELGFSDWQTIAPNQSNPMNASIKVADGVTCTIKNVRLSGKNNSFFGYLSKDCSINGIVFENVELTNEEVNNSAVVATGLISGATLNNVSVRNLMKFDTTATTAGIICATNNGNLIDCNILSENDARIVLRVGNESCTFGGIVGSNKGRIDLCDVTNVLVETYYNINKTGGYMIGGIAGITETNITNCNVNALKLSSACERLMYVGGIVGYTATNELKIYGCLSKATIALGINNENYLGGIVGFASKNTTIITSAFIDGEIKGNSVAGIAGVNYGEITECYSLGTIKGYHIAGLVDRHFGYLANCYTLSTISGESSSSAVCGVVGILGAGSKAEKCFSSATLTGSGKKHAETESEFRELEFIVKLNNFLARRNDEFGDMEDCVIINYGSANVKRESLITGTPGFINTNEEECRGKDDYKVFREEAGFDGAIWDFGNVGEYPTIKSFDDLKNK